MLSTRSAPSRHHMCTDPTELNGRRRWTPGTFLVQSCCILVAAIYLSSAAFAKPHADDQPKLMMRVEAPAADVMAAVQEVTEDQIIHGTYSYEKERILYGAHSAGAARVFGSWQGQGTVFYKVADKIVSPRYFKDTGDIGTISIRYVVQPADANAAIVRIDAIFVDARNVHHASLGNVEAAEFAAIQDRLRNLQAHRQQLQENSKPVAKAAPTAPQPPATSAALGANVSDEPPPTTVAEMQKHVDALRHEVELRVKDEGAQLKSAPFHSAATLESVPGQSEVLIVIVSPYWYGVETEGGHRGWIHHSQLEPLP